MLDSPVQRQQWLGSRSACAGGLLGYKMVVVEMDDEPDPGVSTGSTGEIEPATVQEDTVLGVIGQLGQLNKGQTLAARDVYS